MTQTVFDIQGMHCGSCVGRVERALLARPEIETAYVNLANETAVVEGISPAQALEIAAHVTDSGFPAQIRPPAQERTDQSARNKATQVRLKQQTLIAGLLTLPVFTLEMGGHALPALHHWLHGVFGTPLLWTVQFVLITLVMVWPGRQFYSDGLPALRRGAPDMNALVALGTLAAWGFSSLSLFVPSILPENTQAVYFEAAGVIVTLILLGRYLEARAKGHTGAAIRRLMDLRPKTARVMREGQWQDIDASDIQRGDQLQLRPGETVPADGVVVEGTSHIDESMMTGEPMAIAKTTGALVTGGTVNGNGGLILRATYVGEASTLAHIIRMVEDAQGARLPVQDLVNRVTLWFVPTVMGLAVLTALIWAILGPAPALPFALVSGVSVLIVACPCAMGLATPTSIMVGTGRAAELGVLFRKGDALQSMANLRTIAFDKTGTLTIGRPTVTDFENLGPLQTSDLLSMIAGVEMGSEHPLARAILEYVQAQDLDPAPAQNLQAVEGQGVQAQVTGKDIKIGNAAFLSAAGVDCAPAQGRAERWAAQGKTPVFVSIDGKLSAVLAISDPLKPNARAALAALRAQGLNVAMITGDTQATADAIAKELGIENVVAGVLPKGKMQALRSLSGPIAFVGDGINDAPALAQADVGIAIGTGTDVAIEAADVVLMSGDLSAVLNAVQISQKTLRNIRQNLFWAFAYNILLIPVAAGALYPALGLLLSPVWAAGAMALSSVFVLSNALRLRWVRSAALSPSSQEVAT